jgi:hypothetical protein
VQDSLGERSFMSEPLGRLCYWTIRVASGLGVVLFAVVLSPLWTAKGSSHIPAAALWFVIVAFFIRGVFGGAIRRKKHLLIRSPFWTHRVRWSEISNADLVRGRNSTGLGVVLNSGKHLNVWGTFGTIWSPAPETWLGMASKELHQWIKDSK